MLLWAHEDVVAVACTLKNCRQTGGVPEGVGIKADVDIDSQRSLAILLAIQRVANETLARGNVAVGFNRPATDDFPPALPNPFLNLGKHPRVGTFDPSIVSGRRMAVAEIRGLVHSIQRASKGSEDGIRTISPWPQPRRVNMRMSDDVQDLFLRLAGDCGLLRKGRRHGKSTQGSCAFHKKISP